MDKMCTVPECTAKVLATGLCGKHYQRKRQWGTTDDPDYKARGKTCTEEGCDESVFARRLCHLHYARHWKAANAARPMEAYAELFWAKVDKGDGLGCWWWRATRSPEGYGKYTFKGRTKFAHRMAYELAHGPVPDGMHLHHRCQHPLCVRPDHLEVLEPSVHLGLTRRERGPIERVEPPAKLAPAKREFCTQGHPYDDANTYRSPDGKRHCRICMNKRTRAWREKNPVLKE